jgi:hypothetical protein
LRGLAVAVLMTLTGCSTATQTTTTTAPIVTTTTSATSASPSTTATTAATTTTTAASGAPVVDMVPAGFEIEDFVPLVENYFAVRNWALEHPDEVTEEILATVIEPGSVEMRDTLAEIQDLLDQDAHYEGLGETFELRAYHLVAENSNVDNGNAHIAITYRYGDTALVGSGQQRLASDSLRALAWTAYFSRTTGQRWIVSATLRNPAMYPASP